MGRSEERQREGVGVPEDMASIARTGEASGPHGRLPAVGDRRHEVEESEARRRLQLLVALDGDVGICPALRPGTAMLGQ